MTGSRLLAFGVAALALYGVDAGPCKPHPSQTLSSSLVSLGSSGISSPTVVHSPEATASTTPVDTPTSQITAIQQSSTPGALETSLLTSSSGTPVISQMSTGLATPSGLETPIAHTSLTLPTGNEISSTPSLETPSEVKTPTIPTTPETPVWPTPSVTEVPASTPSGLETETGPKTPLEPHTPASLETLSTQTTHTTPSVLTTPTPAKTSAGLETPTSVKTPQDPAISSTTNNEAPSTPAGEETPTRTPVEIETTPVLESPSVETRSVPSTPAEVETPKVFTTPADLETPTKTPIELESPTDSNTPSASTPVKMTTPAEVEPQTTPIILTTPVDVETPTAVKTPTSDETRTVPEDPTSPETPSAPTPTIPSDIESPVVTPTVKSTPAVEPPVESPPLEATPTTTPNVPPFESPASTPQVTATRASITEIETPTPTPDDEPPVKEPTDPTPSVVVPNPSPVESPVSTPGVTDIETPTPTPTPDDEPPVKEPTDPTPPVVVPNPSPVESPTTTPEATEIETPTPTPNDEPPVKEPTEPTPPVVVDPPAETIPWTCSQTVASNALDNGNFDALSLDPWDQSGAAEQIEISVDIDMLDSAVFVTVRNEGEEYLKQPVAGLDAEQFYVLSYEWFLYSGSTQFGAGGECLVRTDFGEVTIDTLRLNGNTVSEDYVFVEQAIRFQPASSDGRLIFDFSCTGAARMGFVLNTVKLFAQGANRETKCGQRGSAGIIWSNGGAPLMMSSAATTVDECSSLCRGTQGCVSFFVADGGDANLSDQPTCQLYAQPMEDLSIWEVDGQGNWYNLDCFSCAGGQGSSPPTCPAPPASAVCGKQGNLAQPRGDNPFSQGSEGQTLRECVIGCYTNDSCRSIYWKGGGSCLHYYDGVGELSDSGTTNGGFWYDKSCYACQFPEEETSEAS